MLYRILRFAPGSIESKTVVSGITREDARDFERILDRQNLNTGVLHFVERMDGLDDDE
jgi:hypothetical protein